METIAMKIKEHRKATGLTQPAVCEKLAQYGYPIKTSAYSAWETGTSFPNAEQFLALCQIYGIHNIYDEFIGGYTPADPLSELNEEGRKKALDYIHLLNASGEYKRNDIAVMPVSRCLPLYLLPASAGTGEFLDSDDHENVQVGKEVPDIADFGIRVHGDSMMPNYIDGQIVWIQKTQDLFDGEIGIFYLNGEAYIKMLQHNHKGMALISLNKKYAPIPIVAGSDFQIFGRVVG